MLDGAAVLVVKLRSWGIFSKLRTRFGLKLYYFFVSCKTPRPFFCKKEGGVVVVMSSYVLPPSVIPYTILIMQNFKIFLYILPHTVKLPTWLQNHYVLWQNLNFTAYKAQIPGGTVEFYWSVTDIRLTLAPLESMSGKKVTNIRLPNTYPSSIWVLVYWHSDTALLQESGHTTPHKDQDPPLSCVCPAHCNSCIYG